MIAGREALILNGQNIDVLKGRLEANTVMLDAQGNLNIEGGRIDASKASIEVGKDFNLNSTLRKTESLDGKYRKTDVGLDRVAGIYLTSDQGVDAN